MIKRILFEIRLNFIERKSNSAIIMSIIPSTFIIIIVLEKQNT